MIGRTGLREGREKEGEERGRGGERGEEGRERCAPKRTDHSIRCNTPSLECRQSIHSICTFLSTPQHSFPPSLAILTLTLHIAFRIVSTHVSPPEIRTTQIEAIFAIQFWGESHQTRFKMSVTGKRIVGMPTLLLYEAEGCTALVQTRDGSIFRGMIDEVEDNWNLSMKTVIMKAKGSTEEIPFKMLYIRGAQIEFIVLPEMYLFGRKRRSCVGLSTRRCSSACSISRRETPRPRCSWI